MHFYEKNEMIGLQTTQYQHINVQKNILAQKMSTLVIRSFYINGIGLECQYFLLVLKGPSHIDNFENFLILTWKSHSIAVATELKID